MYFRNNKGSYSPKLEMTFKYLEKKKMSVHNIWKIKVFGIKA